MGSRKEIQKKRRHDGEGSSGKNEPSHPLASWFNNPQAFETFITKWEKRRFVTPRDLNAIEYNDPIGDRQRPSVNKLSTEMRILHYLITYTLLPRGGNHGILQHDDILLMWAML
ncbi:hypothetical protein PIB30_102888 [Stylosanthes scabra]|uniref:Uncharacterized protein n=1 Tax=Stylosanthes scabra TaxID=79078 RepID=A0ABU6TZ89_9FABA|nr:hypothetical protein [Stylosanthes scabra]